MVVHLADLIGMNAKLACNLSNRLLPFDRFQADVSLKAES